MLKRLILPCLLIIQLITLNVNAQSTAIDLVSKNVGELEGLLPALEMMHWYLTQAEASDSAHQTAFRNQAIWSVWNWNMHNPIYMLKKDVSSLVVLSAMTEIESLNSSTMDAFYGREELMGVKPGSLESFIIKDQLRNNPEIKAKRKAINKMFDNKIPIPAFKPIKDKLEKLIKFIRQEISDDRLVNKKSHYFIQAKVRTLQRSIRYLGTFFYLPSVGQSTNNEGIKLNFEILISSLEHVRQILVNENINAELVEVIDDYLKSISVKFKEIPRQNLFDLLFNRKLYADPFGRVNNYYANKYYGFVKSEFASQQCVMQLKRL